jgi:hypothetical protein
VNVKFIAPRMLRVRVEARIARLPRKQAVDVLAATVASTNGASMPPRSPVASKSGSPVARSTTTGDSRAQLAQDDPGAAQVARQQLVQRPLLILAGERSGHERRRPEDDRQALRQELVLEQHSPELDAGHHADVRR